MPAGIPSRPTISECSPAASSPLRSAVETTLKWTILEVSREDDETRMTLGSRRAQSQPVDAGRHSVAAHDLGVFARGERARREAEHGAALEIQEVQRHLARLRQLA